MPISDVGALPPMEDLGLGLTVSLAICQESPASGMLYHSHATLVGLIAKKAQLDSV
jgi:hypothetical protein